MPSHHERHLRKSASLLEPRRRLQQSINDEDEIRDGQATGETAHETLENLGPGGRAHAAWRLNFVPTTNEKPLPSKALPAFLPAPTGDTHPGWAMDTTSPRPAVASAAAAVAPTRPSTAVSLSGPSAPTALLASVPGLDSRAPAAASSTPTSAATPDFTKTTHTATGDLTLSLASDNEPTINAAAAPRTPDANSDVQSTSATQVFSQLVQPQVINTGSEASTSTSSAVAAARNSILARLGARSAPPVEPVTSMSLPKTTGASSSGATMSAAPSSSIAPVASTDSSTAATAAAATKRAPREECLSMGFTGGTQLGDCVARLEVSWQ